MKYHAFIPILFAAIIATAKASDGWQLSTRDDGVEYIHFNQGVADSKPPSLPGLLEFVDSLGSKSSKGLQHITFTEIFLSDPKIQRELLAEFSSNHAEVLEAAKSSAGNRHNPKVLPLSAVLEEALLATASIKAIDQKLHVLGFEVSGVSHEKFSLDKGTDPISFHAIVWLEIRPKAENEK